MNEHDLSAGLHTIHRERAVRPGAPSIHQRVRGIQFDDIPQQRRWLPLLPRFQSLFGATKFVVAGAIVALFGGFLLAGVLTQPSEESVPAVGASSDASLSPEPIVDVRELEWRPLDLDEATFGPGARLVDIAASDSMLVIGGSADGSAAIWTSSDRMNWTRVPHDEEVFGGPADQEIKAITPWRDGFVAAGEVDPGSDGGLQRVAAVWVSEDGRTWTRVPHDEEIFGGWGRQEMYDIAATDETLVIVGFDEEVAGTTNEDIAVWTSTDGFAWTQQTFGGGNIQAVEATPEGFVGVGYGGWWTSSDGLRWERTDSDGLRLAGFSGLTQTSDGLVAVGGSSGDRPAAWTSADGATWAPATIDAPFGYDEIWGPNGVAFADSGLAATAGPGDTGGESRILVSVDGRTWTLGNTSVDVADACLGGIASFGSHFVAIGPGSTKCDRTPSSIWTTFVPDGSTPSEEPTADGTQLTTPDLLPGVDLVTEEVEPGMFRIIGDGAGHDFANAEAPIVNGDGSVWLADGFGFEDGYGGIFEVGQPGGHPGGWRRLAFAMDGTLWASGENQPQSVHSFDGAAWTSHGGTRPQAGSEPDAEWPAVDVVDFAVHPDGTAWQIVESNGDDARAGLRHLGPDGWRTDAIDTFAMDPSSLDCAEHSGGRRLLITRDGTMWMRFDGSLMVRSDGDEWQASRPLGPDVDYCVTSVVANRGSVLWAEVQTVDTVDDPEGTDGRAIAKAAGAPSRLGEGRHLARFDGQEWEVFSNGPTSDLSAVADGDHDGPGGIEAVGPDGAVWLTDHSPEPGVGAQTFPVSFDGGRWNRYPELLEDWASDPRNESLRRPRVSQIAIGPDGTAWVAVSAGDELGHHRGLYVITPEAVAATE